MAKISDNLLEQILHGFNIAISLVAMLLIVLGAVASGLSCSSKPTHNTTGTMVLVTTGVFLIMICATGFCGMRAASYPLLFTFAGALASLTLLVVIASILTYVHREDIFNSLKREMETMLENYPVNLGDRKCWDMLQKRNKCCGVDGYFDWLAKGYPLPQSCCHSKPGPHVDVGEELCISVGGEIRYLHPEGCFEKFGSSLRMYADELLSGGLLLAFLTISPIIISCWLAIRMRNRLR